MPFLSSHTEVEARMLDRALRPGAEVLEAGCGRTTRLRGHRGRLGRLVGVDLDAAGGGENDALDEFLVADLGGRLPFADSSFDLVYANFVVEHLERPAEAFAEWRRLLRDGGGVVLVTSNRSNPAMAAARLLPQRVRETVKRVGPGAAGRDVFPAVYRANTPADLERLLSGAGFTPVEVACVATLHRYAGDRRLPAAVLREGERLLPARMRSTIVGWYRAG